MSDVTFRAERIEKLLKELRYEIERGIVASEISEQMHFAFYVPVSRMLPDGVVYFEAHMAPLPRGVMYHQMLRAASARDAGRPMTSHDIPTAGVC